MLWQITTYLLLRLHNTNSYNGSSWLLPQCLLLQKAVPYDVIKQVLLQGYCNVIIKSLILLPLHDFVLKLFSSPEHKSSENYCHVPGVIVVVVHRQRLHPVNFVVFWQLSLYIVLDKDSDHHTKAMFILIFWLCLRKSLYKNCLF